MKHINIVSYYSDDDNNLDAIYSIDYQDDLVIDLEIECAYEEMSDNGEMTNELSCVLDYLIKEKGYEIKYETLQFDIFNCDYGIFRSKY